MTTLTTSRAELAAALEAAGIPAKDHLPERITPPVAVLTAGDPWLEPANLYGHHTVRWVVTVVVPTGTNEHTAAQLDQLTTAALPAMVDAGPGWDVTVGRPYPLTAGGATYLAVDLAATTPLPIT